MVLFPSTQDPDDATQVSSPVTTQYSYHPSQVQGDQSQEKVENEFSTAEIRKAFVKKVYVILTIQLLVVLGFILFFSFHQPTKRWIQNNTYILYISLAVAFMSIVLLAFFMDFRRKAPWNYLFLGAYTVAEGVILGMLASCYARNAVLTAVAITAIITLALTVFALKSKYDFTTWGGFLICFSIPILILGIICIFVRKNILDYVYSAVTCVMFSMYLVYDTQLMLMGKHKYTVGPDDYVFATLNLYVDIVNIFMIVLDLLFKSKK
ncbi:protein lifeguard 1-like [Cydia splendana]|uniref:protein lifeguard 1-like n=1 Tax=Cydia splendana TaxID=1100963 RepID=UPI0028F48323